MWDTIIACLAVGLSLFLTIFVHEWSHYLVAKKLGVVCKSINIGIGPVVLSHCKLGGIPINLRLMPIGGFIDMEEMTFFKRTNISPRKRCLIAIAGPAGNLALCVYIALILWVVGIPIYSGSTTVGAIWSDCTLDVKPGDRVLSINQKPVSSWMDIKAAIFYNSSTNIAVITARGNQHFTNDVPILLFGLLEPKIPLSPVQNLYYRPTPFQAIDVIAVDGSPYFNGDTFYQALATNRPVTVTLRYNGRTYNENWKLNQQLVEKLWERESSTVHPNPVVIIGSTAGQILKTVGQLFHRNTNLSPASMAGPLTTMLYLQRFFYTDIRLGIFLLLALNLNLVLFNLLPTYPMDGAHLLHASLEKTRFLVPMKKAMYFITWAILFLLVYMMLLDVIKFAVL